MSTKVIKPTKVTPEGGAVDAWCFVTSRGIEVTIEGKHETLLATLTWSQLRRAGVDRIDGKEAK